MTTLTRLRAAVRQSWQRRRRKQKLRRELADYRTPSERAELEALLARYDTTVAEILRSVDRVTDTAEAAPPTEAVTILDLSLIPEQRRR